MKKIILLAVITILSITVSAQGFRTGVRVNAGLSDVKGYTDGKMCFGYGLGWIAEYNFNPKFYLRTGIGLENIASQVWDDGTKNAFFAQVPVHMGYRFVLNGDNSLFIQAGPTLGVGLFASKLNGDGEGAPTDYFDHLRRIDFGIGCRVGIEVDRFLISAGVYNGLINAHIGNPPNIKCHNLSVNLGVAYMF